MKNNSLVATKLEVFCQCRCLAIHLKGTLRGPEVEVKYPNKHEADLIDTHGRNVGISPTLCNPSLFA